MMKNIIKPLLGLFALFILGTAHAQVPTPLSHFGFEIGTSYHLTNYTQTEEYFKKIAQSSERVLLKDLGLTEEGRNQYMVVVSSPENIENIDTYQALSRELALGNMPDSVAKKLANQGKAVVWIDGGLHSTETVGIHQLIETIYQVVSRNDDEIKKILEDVVILFVHANPDGHELVGNWYMKEPQPEKRRMTKLPSLYNKYIGHDNNRDFFMFNVSESRNLARPLFVDWIPQIVYNHHQSAPAGTIVVGPPYRDPFNYVYDPILMTSLDAIGAAMHTRLNVEDKPGYGQRGASRYSTWWNGGLRTSVYFHNMIGILTEIVGSPNPTTIPLYLNRILPNSDSPNPVHPQAWNFKKSIDYSVSLNMAVLNYAAKNKADLLYNIYKMGNNSIKKGSVPSLSISPSQIDFLRTKSDVESSNKISNSWYDTLQVGLDRKDPIAYVLPANQTDFGTAIKFLNRLILGGVEVERAHQPFEIDGKSYPQGSYVVRLSQAFRPHILDMFEPQDHPNDVAYAGGPPIPPYDAAGWTLAYTMGVKFDRIKSNLPEGKLTRIERGNLLEFDSNYLYKGKYLKLESAVNDNFKLVNMLLSLNRLCYRDENGSFYIENSKENQKILSEQRHSIGFKTTSTAKLPTNKTVVKSLRVALWDTYGGSIKSGWMRWLLEDFNYNFDVIYNPTIDQGNLRDKYDVIIFAGGGISSSLKKRTKADVSKIPSDYKEQVGSFSSDYSLPAMREFVNQGGKVVLIGNTTNLAKHLGVPQLNPLVKEVDGKRKSLSRQEFYIPGSVLTVNVNTSAVETSGLNEQVDVYFNNNPVFKFEAGNNEFNIKPLLSINSSQSLKSGWALGENYLENTVMAYRADLGKGKIYAFGPEIVFRAQTHGTFKLLFNQLY